MRIWHEAELIELENLAEDLAGRAGVARGPAFVRQIRELIAGARANGLVEPIPPAPPGPIGPRPSMSERRSHRRRKRVQEAAVKRRAAARRLMLARDSIEQLAKQLAELETQIADRRAAIQKARTTLQEARKAAQAKDGAV